MRVLVVAFVLVAVAFAARKCGRNEQWTDCGTACEPKCTDNGPMMCTMQCIPDACQCKPGYKRDAKGVCVANCNARVRREASCMTMRCSKGFKCEQVRVNCFVAPCPQPPPQCVPV